MSAMEGDARSVHRSGHRSCLGEWRGSGKTIKITDSSGELLVDMGPGVPALTLVVTSRDKAWPMTWAVVRRNEPGKTPGPQSTVYVIELPSPSSMRLLVKKPTGDGVVEFERVEQFEDAAPARSRSPRKGGKMSFADSLAKIVSERKVVHTDHERLSNVWLEYEAQLLDKAVALFKQRCVREAESQKCTATISFEVLSREIEGFPKRSLAGSTYYVGTWGDGLSSENWFYATRGITASFSPDDKVLFAEVLQPMLPKFVDRVKLLGFQSCSHEAGTWKISVSWPAPPDGE